jgi:sulfotransferase family protein
MFPIIVVGRAHSGTRLLVDLLRFARIFMGADLIPAFCDSSGWYREFAVPLINSRFFPDWTGCGDPDSQLNRFARERSFAAQRSYWGPHPQEGKWGWKYAETLFAIPVVTALFPQARFLHVIRDGRDVALCDEGYFQLSGRHSLWSDDPESENGSSQYLRFCSAITFGAHDVTEWNGIRLSDRKAITENRFLIQAQSWVNAVTRARSYGKGLGFRYLEIRYEDLCARPEQTIVSLCQWLGERPYEESFQKMLALPIAGRTGKWRIKRFTLSESRDFLRGVRLMEGLLTELGYEE